MSNGDVVDLVAALRASVEAARKSRVEAEAERFGGFACLKCLRVVANLEQHERTCV